MLEFLKQYPARYWHLYLAGALALLCTNYLGTLIPRKIETAIDILKTKQADSETFNQVIVSIIALGLGVLVVRTLSRILIFFPGRFVEFDLRNDLYRHLIGLSSSFFNKNETGDLMSRLINDIQNLRLMVGFAFLNLGNAFILFPFAIWQMAKINMYLTICTVLPAPFIMAFILAIAKKYYGSLQRSQSLLGKISNQAVETFGGINTVKCFNSESAFSNSFNINNLEYQRATTNVAFYRSLMFPMLAVIGSIGNFVLFYMGGPMIVEGKLTVGEFTAFSAYIALLAWPTASMAYMISVYLRGKVAIERIRGILDESPTISDHSLTDFKLQLNQPPSIELKNFSFAFPDKANSILKNISFRIEAGQTLGVFGTTGSGKSVLADIVARTIPIDKGSVFINNTDLLNWPIQTYRKAISYVPQNSFLFSDSLAENIAYAEQGIEPELQKVEDSALAAEVLNDILSFPNKFSTLTGEKGVVLSGGQKNRIALARAFYKKHQILILDDVLSSVDHDTEKRLVEYLKRKASDSPSTNILVSHRISVLTFCDQIIVLENGKITAQGNHQQLLAQPGIYLDSWNYQKLEAP